MNQFMLSFMPVGVCNLTCPNCTQAPWLEDFGGYQMSPYEVQSICDRVRVLGLRFEWAHITGGEPALWQFLKEGCQIIRESNLFDHTEVWSNCKSPKPLAEVLELGLVDKVVTQSGNHSKAGAKKLKEEFGNQVVILETAGHQVHPDGPLDNAIPALCGCDKTNVFNHRVWPCPNVYSNMVRLGIDVESSGLWAPLESDWKTAMDNIDRFGMEACKVCLANGKVSCRAPMGKTR